MKHAIYILLCYDHKSFSAAKDAFVEVQAEEGQLLNELAEKAKRKLCESIHLPEREVCIHDCHIYHELPLFIKDEQSVPSRAAVPAAPNILTAQAHWECEHESWGRLQCSNCKKEALLEKSNGDVGTILLYVTSNYCPYCGAKMDAN